MGCSSCGTGDKSSKGCGSKGSCSSGGCNKLEVHDWLANMQLPNGQAHYDILEIRFKNSRKLFYRNAKNLPLKVGDVVIVEASPGYDVGVVSIEGELARIQVNKKAPDLKPLEIKKIMRVATQEDIDKWGEARALENEVMFQARTLAVNLGLEMKISDVEYQGDLTKATFYYTAETRVDFRQLIKDMADKFKIRIEMRQIGARQEAQRLGGLGPCGRELCCSTWLTDFRTVSTSAARYQQLSLNPQKLTGLCGKLKCCLNYELDMYLEAIKEFPNTETKLYTEKGYAYHVKTDVFKRQLWYAYAGEAGIGSGLICLNPKRVHEIIRLNKSGQKPAELKDFEDEVVTSKELDYDNVVGQDSLNRFDGKFKSSNNRRKKKKTGGNNQNPQAVAQQAVSKPINPNQGGENKAPANPNQQRNNKRRSKNRNRPNNPSNNNTNE